MSLQNAPTGSETREAGLPSRTIVVGYDGSELARAALALAALRAGPHGRLVPVYAAPIPPADVLGLPAPAPAPAPEPEEIGRRILAEIGDAETGAASVTPQVRVGGAAQALVEVARAEHADEIVVGSHGTGRLRALLGSTSHALVHDADRPVVILTERAAERVSGPTEPAHLIVLGYDGSEDARAALAYARAHLAFDGEIVAVHAYHAPPGWKGGATYEADLDARLTKAEALVGDVRAIDGVSLELVQGDPAHCIAAVAAARAADEIVVGTRGLGTLRATLGSVAHALLHEADRPIVIVPR